MAKRFFYRCENEYGSDPCEFAQKGSKIADTEVISAMDGGNPKCPGKTRSGKDCGSELISIGSEGGSSSGILKFGLVGGVLAILGLIAVWYFGLIGGGEPIIKVEPASLIFPRAEAGAATASLRVSNNGDGALIIERIEANPPVISTSEDKIQIEPDDAVTLQIHFKSSSAEMTEGELLLYSNAQDSPTTIRLIANQDPWWVDKKLKNSSKIISTEP